MPRVTILPVDKTLANGRYLAPPSSSTRFLRIALATFRFLLIYLIFFISPPECSLFIRFIIVVLDLPARKASAVNWEGHVFNFRPLKNQNVDLWLYLAFFFIIIVLIWICVDSIMIKLVLLLDEYINAWKYQRTR